MERGKLSSATTSGERSLTGEEVEVPMTFGGRGKWREGRVSRIYSKVIIFGKDVAREQRRDCLSIWMDG